MRSDTAQFTFAEAQTAVREFANSEVRALAPMAGEMLVLYDEGNYGPNGRDSPPNLELITKRESIWETATDTGLPFEMLLDRYHVEVLAEEDLTHTRSDAKSKAYVGIPNAKIHDPENADA